MNHIRVEDVREFSKEKRIRKKLLGTEKIGAEYLCYEPGQGTPMHHHPKQDELFYVVEGRGILTVGDEEIPVGPSSLVLARAQVPHGMMAASDSRMIVMFFKAPISTSSALRGEPAGS